MRNANATTMGYCLVICEGDVKMMVYRLSVFRGKQGKVSGYYTPLSYKPRTYQLLAIEKSHGSDVEYTFDEDKDFPKTISYNALYNRGMRIYRFDIERIPEEELKTTLQQIDEARFINGI